MYERILRNSISMMFWIAVLVLAVSLQVVLFSVTYLGFRIACELMGYENIPLGKDVLIGWFFSAFLTEATVAHLFAMGLSGVITLGLFLFFYLMFDCIEIIEEKSPTWGHLRRTSPECLTAPCAGISL